MFSDLLIYHNGLTLTEAITISADESPSDKAFNLISPGVFSELIIT